MDDGPPVDPTPREALAWAFGVDGMLRRFRERRRRGTRRKMNWKYFPVDNLYAPLAILFGIVGGLDLLSKAAIWQRVAGGLLLVASVLAAGLYVRWLLRPVDPESRERVRRFNDE